MTATVIRHEDHEEVPWNNGLGVTREIANAYLGDGSLAWRISLATIDKDGAFSDFSGAKRIQILLSGPGFVLDFGDHGSAAMQEPFHPVTFDGGWPTSAQNVAGTNRVLNVVTARPHADGRVAVQEVDRDGLRLASGSSLRLFYVLTGALRGEINGKTMMVKQGETLRMDDAASTGLAMPERESSLVYRIDIDLA
jgi:environmental stress-induced protein Ves